MSKIINHSVFFNHVIYELISPHNLIDPDHFGLLIKKESYDPLRFQTSYAIANDLLILVSLSCNISQPKGLAGRIKALLFGYPPKIKGIKGTASDHDCYIHYNHLNIPIRYTGVILVGLGDINDQDLGIDADDPNTYVKLVKLKCIDGNVISIVDIPGNVPYPERAAQIIGKS